MQDFLIHATLQKYICARVARDRKGKIVRARRLQSLLQSLRVCFIRVLRV